MRYALLIYGDPHSPELTSPPPEAPERWSAYTRELKKSGALLAAEQLTPAASSTSVRMRGDERLLSDGPFAETKEHLLGFYLVDVPTLDEALDWAAKMPSARYGTIEVRPVVSQAPWRDEL